MKFKQWMQAATIALLPFYLGMSWWCYVLYRQSEANNRAAEAAYSKAKDERNEAKKLREECK